MFVVCCCFSFYLVVTCSRVVLGVFKDFIYLFLERGEGKEKERERNISMWLPFTHLLPGPWPATQACALTRNRTSDPLVRRPALNPLSHTSQGCSRVFNSLESHLLEFFENLGKILFLRGFLLVSGSCPSSLPIRSHIKLNLSLSRSHL